MRLFRVGVLVVASVCVGVIACDSGGGGGGTGGGGPTGDPATDCQSFMSLSQDCYQRAGKTFNLNPAACSDPSVLDERTLGQIECALSSRDAYCNSIIYAYNRDAATLDPNDPEIRRLNNCNAEKTTTGDCRAAIQKLEECGGTYFFPPECTGSSAAAARCILDNPTGACAIYAPREAGTALPPEAQTFQQCQIAAAKVDAGDQDAF